MRLLQLLAGRNRIHSFDSVQEMLQMFAGELAHSVEPVYLSIDKDVLAHDVVQTNWDQGLMTFDELLGAVSMLAARIIAADITGEVSSYRYKSRFKRWLSALDAQPALPADSIAGWQRRHQNVNHAILAALG